MCVCVCVSLSFVRVKQHLTQSGRRICFIQLLLTNKWTSLLHIHHHNFMSLLLFPCSCGALQCCSEAVLHNHVWFSTCIKSVSVSTSHRSCRSFTFSDDKGAAFTFSHRPPLHQISFPACAACCNDGNENPLMVTQCTVWECDGRTHTMREEEEERWRCLYKVFPRSRITEHKQEEKEKKTNAWKTFA